MTLASSKRTSLLFVGDFVVLIVSLWITLFVRYAAAPSAETLYDHFTAFLPLLLIWILVFFISGLYEKQTVIFKDEIPLTLFRAQLVNAVIAVIFFYLAPFLPIAPKTVLFLFVIISSLFLLVWRTEIFPRFSKPVKQNAVIIGSGGRCRN